MRNPTALTAAAVVLASGMLLASCGGTSPEQRAYREASKNCQQWVKESSKNPSAAKIPQPASVRSASGQIIVQWEHGEGLTLMNGFGANVDSTARCTMSSDGHFLKELVINDEVIRRSSSD
ncbi:hypothetical protein ROW33_03965 [Stenotrophomonas maltophilia]|uniref:hypothetical protein n=1 Tax=Stenotrophomonas maltophilia TaxID=40324 RepID=UPI0028939675|nr:hypothetical protein [Stenotrophomonas maltophilia]MDT3447828.1 hypothetical protein [Stenotrophomonas maltophilia]